MSSTGPAALPYHEPGIVTILIISSFLLLLNAINYTLDRIVYCGLVGQILVGTAWGVPGAQWLSQAVQESVMQLGYLGLILIVYEGGLSTSIPTLKRNLPLSATVALIGISAPIALSYVLQAMLPITALQAFAAGAALCSTSLGTTFTVLSTSGLTESRLGVVLTSAAMMDDVIGLVMVQVISSLGDGADISAVTVVRPVLVSIAFAVIVPLLCAFVVGPTARLIQSHIIPSGSERLKAALLSQRAKLVFDTAVLLILVTGSTYAGTSNLFAAYLAGAAISWLDGVIADGRSGMHASSLQPQNASAVSTSGSIDRNINAPEIERPAAQTHAPVDVTGIFVYDFYFKPAVESILKPFFFASIGFSIPITQMFGGSTVWKGFVYSALMIFGKLLCGLALVRITSMSTPISCIKTVWPLKTRSDADVKASKKTKNGRSAVPLETVPAGNRNASASSTSQTPTNGNFGSTSESNTANTSRKRHVPPQARSLYPSLMLGSAMVARGEIGFLISSVAESTGVFGAGTDGGSSELFLVVTWAILICTIVGPLSIGLLVRRVKRLQLLERERGKGSGKGDPLGAWGVVATS
ncbi:hypothetical protein Q7P37_005736 [Cladosporium fusiforme]